MITVLILTGILAATAASYWPGEGINLSAQTEQLAGDLRYLQSMAVTHGQRTRINFAADRYWFSDIDNTARLPHPMAALNDVILDTGITLASSNAFLVFDSDGVPYTNAVLPGNALGSDAVITLSAAGTTRTLRISPQTGRVLLQ